MKLNEILKCVLAGFSAAQVAVVIATGGAARTALYWGLVWLYWTLNFLEGRYHDN